MRYSIRTAGVLLLLPLTLAACLPKTGDNTNITDEPTEETTPTTTNTITGRLSDLVGLGQSVTCTFTNTDEFGTSDGTVFVAGERMRGNFVSTDKTGVPANSSMIYDGEYSYFWGNQMDMGMKTRIVDLNELDLPDQSEVPGRVDTSAPEMADNVEYNCENWNVDESVFTPPADVEFIDASAQMDALREMQGE